MLMIMTRASARSAGSAAAEGIAMYRISESIELELRRDSDRNMHMHATGRATGAGSGVGALASFFAIAAAGSLSRAMHGALRFIVNVNKIPARAPPRVCPTS